MISNTKQEIVLASTSPRRHMLLKQVNIPFKFLSPDAHEAMPASDDFGKIVCSNALDKAKSVSHLAEGRLILGADTLVEFEGAPLGKPRDKDDAFKMLNLLSGQEHRVYTGIALVNSTTGETFTEFVKTSVIFRELEKNEIAEYIQSGEPMDKAGSYGIQARGALFIQKIDGCFFNVMGLPLSRLWILLHKAGWR